MKRIVIFAALLLLLGVALQAEAASKNTNLYDINLLNGIVIGDSVRVTNVTITAIDKNPTTYGFYVQEVGGGPHSGMLIYNGSLFPTGLRLGNIMNVYGLYTEYTTPDTSNACSEINSFYANMFDTTGYRAVPAPVLLSCSNLGYDGTDAPIAERWENVLVKVDSVKVVNGASSYPRSYVIKEAHNHAGATAADTIYVRNDKMDANAPIRPADGDTLLSITGIFYYEYGQYRLCPRDGDDIIPLHSPPPHVLRAYATSNTTMNVLFDSRVQQASAENTGNYTLGTEKAVIGASLDPVGEQIVTLTTATETPGTVEDVTVVNVRSKAGTLMQSGETYPFRAGLCPMSLVQTMKSALNDSSQYSGEQVTVGGIVTGDKTAYITEFYMENTPGGPWSGIQVYGGIPTPVAEGDSVIVSGYVAEYYNMTEVTPVHYLRIVSSGNPVPGPNWVLPGQIKTGSATAESYEGVFVRVDPGFVTDTTGWRQFGEWRINDPRHALDTVVVGHTGGYVYTPWPGKWVNIRGPMSYTYNNFRIEPRRTADIDTVNITDAGPGTQPKPPVFALEQNSPNPFNPVTNIFFSVPAKTKVELYVCDVTGRVVKTLVDGVTMDPGRHKAIWDGSNNAGRAVSSGVYFAKLLAANKVAQMKMVVLK